MSSPAFHRDGDRLVFPLRPDKRAIGAFWRTTGVVVTALGAAGVALADDWQVGLGALAAVALLCGLLFTGMGALVLWINRQTVIFDAVEGAFQGLAVDLGQVVAVRIGARSIHYEGAAERRLTLELVGGAQVSAVARAAAASLSVPEALLAEAGVLVTDHPDRDALLAAGRALAAALDRPLVYGHEVPPRWHVDRQVTDGLKHATTPLPNPPGPAPKPLTVHSLRPLDVTWPGIRYQGALWATLGFFLLPFGAGLALHRAVWDGPTALLVGVPLAIFSYGLITRRGTHRVRVDGRTVRSVHPGLLELEIQADQVLGFTVERSAKGNLLAGFRLEEASRWGTFPDEKAAIEWLQAAAERAIRTGGAD